MMRIITTSANWVTRITGLFQIILGVLFWLNIAKGLVPVHMLSGTLLVIGLWVLAFQAIQTRANPGFGFFAIVWGVITVAFGMLQMQLLPGAAHWVIQVIHLLIGIIAMGQADQLGRCLESGPALTV